jgi:hypothetical protein
VTPAPGTSVLDPTRIRDISPDVLDDAGRLRVLPAAYWADTTADERALFGHRHGIYSFPTVELVEHLRDLIGGRSAIEVGAGHGVLAEALGIPATDNRMQEKDPYRQVYAATGQPPVRYGPNVIDCHASRAVRRYRPQVVIGCWVTHKYDPARHEAGGNEVGVDEPDVLRNCGAYVLVGNEQVHAAKAIWRRPHQIEYPPFVYSRANNGSRDFIAVWPGARRADGPRRIS